MTAALVAAGVLLVAVAAVDVFLVVLYLRGGAGLVTPALSDATWWAFRRCARLSRHHRARVLSYGGPVLLVVIAAGWGLLVLMGTSLVMWPFLGDGVRATSGPTPTGFGAAVYVAAMNLTTLGIGDLVPATTPLRLATVAMAVLGFSLLTLSVTYVLSVYNALLRRNTFAIDVHHRTASSGDAAEWLALGAAGGDPAPLQQDLMQIMQELVRLYESHQLYPVLHYFRYPQEHYALARIGLVVLDGHALIRTALDAEAYPTLVRGGATRGVWESAHLLMTGLGRTFLPGEGVPGPDEVAPAREAAWRERYRRARERLASEGLSLAPADEGEAAYLELRRRWEPWVEAFARRLDYDEDAIFADGTRGERGRSGL